MKRIAFKMQLKPGFEQEYKRRHDEIWPELSALLKSKGIAEYSIFLDKTNLSLTGILKIDDPAKMDELPAHDIMKRWWTYMKDIMDSNPDHSPVAVPLEEVFYMP